MLALIYFGLAVCLGDQLCRRSYQFVSVAHRWAAATIAGLLVSSWFSYLTGVLFTRTQQPLLWGNLLFFVTAIAALFWHRWKNLRSAAQITPEISSPAQLYLPRAKGSSIAD